MQLTPRVRHVAAVDRSVGHEGEGRVEEWRRLWILEEERPCAASGEDSLASESCVTEEKNHPQSVSVRAIPYPCYCRPRWIHRLHACWEAAAADMYDDMVLFHLLPSLAFPSHPV